MSKNENICWWLDDPRWKKTATPLFSVESIGPLEGITPHTVGIIVAPNDPRYTICLDPCNSKGISITSGTEKRVSSFLYGSGTHTLRITCITNTREGGGLWYSEQHTICVKTREEARKEDPNCIITNFFYGSGSGQYLPGSTGLDVDFSVSWDENPTSIMWQFSDNIKQKNRIIGPIAWPKAASYMSQHYVYKELGDHMGFVRIVTNKGHICERHIQIRVTDNRRPKS
ncbi:hypothetical protein NMT12_90141 [metagenome]